MLELVERFTPGLHTLMVDLDFRHASLWFAGVAVLFGLATLVAGLGVLLGRSDPGYPVFGPLLTFNTGMGVVYVAVGVAA